MTEGIWEKIAIILFTALIAGAPGYVLVGPSKTTRVDVADIIEVRVPFMIETIVKDLRASSSQIDKRLSVMEERLLYISRYIERLKK